MTLAEIKSSDEVFLNAADIADVLQADPATIRLAAKQRPELLGFPVCVCGRRVRIPRLAFIAFVEGATA